MRFLFSLNFDIEGGWELVRRGVGDGVGEGVGEAGLGICSFAHHSFANSLILLKSNE